MSKKLSWSQAKNLLATGVAKEVKYYSGEIASYQFVSGIFRTYYYGMFNSNREPCNPHYGFRVVR